MLSMFIVLLLAFAFVVHGLDQCSYAINIFTTSCASACQTNEPCVAFQAKQCRDSRDLNAHCKTSPNAPACAFECFSATATAPTYANTSLALVASPDNSTHDKLPTKTFMTRLEVGMLDVSSNASEVFIVGGTKYFNYYYSNYSPKIELRLSPRCLVKQSDVTSVVLSNFNVTSSIATLGDYLPFSLKSLDLSNNVLPMLPTDLHRFSRLENLYVMYGSVPILPRSLASSSVKHANFFQSRVSTFEADFPNVERLFLGNNFLSVIPPVIFTLKQLKQLTLDNNPLASVTVNRSQFDFLRNIETLSLTGIEAPASQCNGTSMGLGGVTFCVVDDAKSTNTIQERTVSKFNVTWVFVGVVVTLGVCVLCVGIFVWCRRRERKPHPKGADVTVTTATGSDLLSASVASSDQSSSQQSGVRLLWSDEELMSHRVSSEAIVDIRHLGGGATCKVWLVQHVNGRFLASKRPKREVLRRNAALLKFLAEVKLNGVLVHPRVIRLAGIAWTSMKDLQVLFEYAPQGDLFDWLQRRSTDRQWGQPKTQIASDIAEALVYVHSFAPPVVHRDLKSRNVLLDQQSRAKLCDFGCARFQSENATMTAGVGTARWLAPEVITGQDYDGKADVYSLGVLLSEMATHTLPFGNVADDGGMELSDAAIMHKVTRGELRPSFGDNCLPEVVALGQKCLSLDPMSRPSAMEVFHSLRKIAARTRTSD